VVHDWGGAGDPVLLAHPTGFHGMVWAPVARRLIAAGRAVWSFDFRGHGDSDPSPNGYHWQGFGDDVAAVAAHLGLARQPSLLAAGHSKGAAALVLAELEAPGTFTRLWCHEPIMIPVDTALPPADDIPLVRDARKRRAVWDTPTQAFDSYRSRRPLSTLDAESLRAYVDYGLRPRPDGRVELKCRPDDEADMYAMMPAHGAFARLAELRLPVLVACGEHSDAIGPSVARLIADRIPNGQLELLPGVGHFGPLEDPERATQSMLRFADATRDLAPR
jgi:pimeloyl-ACP methyl ester carboxylesterase